MIGPLCRAGIQGLIILTPLVLVWLSEPMKSNPNSSRQPGVLECSCSKWARGPAAVAAPMQVQKLRPRPDLPN